MVSQLCFSILLVCFCAVLVCFSMLLVFFCVVIACFCVLLACFCAVCRQDALELLNALLPSAGLDDSLVPASCSFE